jgi:hypothetical protein
MITAILLGLLVLLAACIDSQRRLSVLALAVAFTIGIGATMIAFPDLANSVARHLNAGRGADLLLYLLALSGIFTGSAAGHFRSAACTGKEIAAKANIASHRPRCCWPCSGSNGCCSCNTSAVGRAET